MINHVCDDQFGVLFTNTLPRASPALGLHKTRLEKQQVTREMKRNIIAEVEKQYAENVAISHLAEGESDASYTRKRKRSSFDPPNRVRNGQQFEISVQTKRPKFLQGCQIGSRMSLLFEA